MLILLFDISFSPLTLSQSCDINLILISFYYITIKHLIYNYILLLWNFVIIIFFYTVLRKHNSWIECSIFWGPYHENHLEVENKILHVFDNYTQIYYFQSKFQTVLSWWPGKISEVAWTPMDWPTGYVLGDILITKYFIYKPVISSILWFTLATVLESSALSHDDLLIL